MSHEQLISLIDQARFLLVLAKGDTAYRVTAIKELKEMNKLFYEAWIDNVMRFAYPELKEGSK
jgi:hypothetical protein